MSWHGKSENSDLFFCVNVDCNIITFRIGGLGTNLCPKCNIQGALVRTASILQLGIPNESPAIKETPAA